MTCTYFGLLLSLAAIIIVDDTNLLSRAEKDHSHEDLFSFIQEALNFWELLVLALHQPRSFPLLQFQIP